MGWVQQGTADQPLRSVCSTGCHDSPVRTGICDLMSQKRHDQGSEKQRDLPGVAQLRLLGWGSRDFNTSF